MSDLDTSLRVTQPANLLGYALERDEVSIPAGYPHARCAGPRMDCDRQPDAIRSMDRATSPAPIGTSDTVTACGPRLTIRWANCRSRKSATVPAMRRSTERGQPHGRRFAEFPRLAAISNGGAELALKGYLRATIVSATSDS
jgi:hypothetical protein